MEDFQRTAIIYVVGTFGERGANLNDVQGKHFYFGIQVQLDNITSFIFVFYSSLDKYERLSKGDKMDLAVLNVLVDGKMIELRDNLYRVVHHETYCYSDEFVERAFETDFYYCRGV